MLQRQLTEDQRHLLFTQQLTQAFTFLLEQFLDRLDSEGPEVILYSILTFSDEVLQVLDVTSVSILTFT